MSAVLILTEPRHFHASAAHTAGASPRVDETSMSAASRELAADPENERR